MTMSNLNKMKHKNEKKAITVNGEIYKWTVADFNCDNKGGSYFKIYKDDNIVYSDIIYDEIITPGKVEQIIKINKRIIEIHEELNNL